MSVYPDDWVERLTDAVRKHEEELAKCAEHPRYETLEKLEEDDEAALFRARDRVDGTVVAIRILNSGPASDPVVRHRFREEAGKAIALCHENLVRMLATGEADGETWVALEYVPGILLTQASLPDLPAKLRVIRDAARALQYAHEHGIVHGDVKPSNVLITPEDVVKVTGFGAARVTLSGRVVGTPGYVSPEQARGAPGPRSDVYSLGATMYELLTGRKPAGAAENDGTGALRAAPDAVPAPPERIDGGVPKDVRKIILMAMRRDPQERQSSAGAFADQIDAFLRKEPIPELDRLVEKTGSPSLLGRATVLAAAAAVAALVVSWLIGGIDRDLRRFEEAIARDLAEAKAAYRELRETRSGDPAFEEQVRGLEERIDRELAADLRRLKTAGLAMKKAGDERRLREGLEAMRGKPIRDDHPLVREAEEFFRYAVETRKAFDAATGKFGAALGDGRLPDAAALLGELRALRIPGEKDPFRDAPAAVSSHTDRLVEALVEAIRREKRPVDAEIKLLEKWGPKEVKRAKDARRGGIDSGIRAAFADRNPRDLRRIGGYEKEVAPAAELAAAFLEALAEIEKQSATDLKSAGLVLKTVDPRNLPEILRNDAADLRSRTQAAFVEKARKEVATLAPEIGKFAGRNNRIEAERLLDRLPMREELKDFGPLVEAERSIREMGERESALRKGLSELKEAGKKGEPGAFGVLYARYSPDTYAGFPEHGPGLAEAIGILCDGLLRERKYAEAHRWLGRAIGHDGGDPDLFESRGVAARESRSWDEATEDWKKALALLESKPAYKDAWVRRAVLHRRLGNLDEAISSAEKAREGAGTPREKADAELLLGTLEFIRAYAQDPKAAGYPDALAHLTRAAENHPDPALVRYWVGTVRRPRDPRPAPGRMREALEDFSKVVSSPGFRSLHAAYQAALLQLDLDTKHEEAAELAGRVLSAGASLADFEYLAAGYEHRRISLTRAELLFRRDGLLARARARFELVKRSAPEKKSGEFEQAQFALCEADLKAALAMNLSPKLPSALYHLGAVKYECNLSEEAGKLFEEVIKVTRDPEEKKNAEEYLEKVRARKDGTQGTRRHPSREPFSSRNGGIRPGHGVLEPRTAPAVRHLGDSPGHSVPRAT